MVDPPDRWHLADTVRAVAGAAVLGASWALAVRDLSDLEARVFARVNDTPDWALPVLWPVMQLGNIWVATVVAVGAALVLRRPRLVPFFAAAPWLAWIGAKAIKDAVERGRPAAEGLTVIQRGAAEDGFGFISGHTAVAFALATVIAPHLGPRWAKLALFAVAGVVGIARMYVGVHLPLDVVGGAAFGILVGEVVRLVEHLARRWLGGATTAPTVGPAGPAQITPR